MGNKEYDERRENMRFLVADNAVAVMGPVTSGLGHVIELSMNGFSFYCETREEVPREREENLTFFGFETLNLGPVHLTTVSDSPVQDEEGNTVGRRCGVRFVDLSDGQKDQLRQFIYQNAYIEV